MAGLPPRPESSRSRYSPPRRHSPDDRDPRGVRSMAFSASRDRRLIERLNERSYTPPRRSGRPPAPMDTYVGSSYDSRRDEVYRRSPPHYDSYDRNRDFWERDRDRDRDRGRDQRNDRDRRMVYDRERGRSYDVRRDEPPERYRSPPDSARRPPPPDSPRRGAPESYRRSSRSPRRKPSPPPRSYERPPSHARSRSPPLKRIRLGNHHISSRSPSPPSASRFRQPQSSPSRPRPPPSRGERSPTPRRTPVSPSRSTDRARRERDDQQEPGMIREDELRGSPRAAPRESGESLISTEQYPLKSRTRSPSAFPPTPRSPVKPESFEDAALPPDVKSEEPLPVLKAEEDIKPAHVPAKVEEKGEIKEEQMPPPQDVHVQLRSRSPPRHPRADETKMRRRTPSPPRHPRARGERGGPPVRGGMYRRPGSPPRRPGSPPRRPGSPPRRPGSPPRRPMSPPRRPGSPPRRPMSPPRRPMSPPRRPASPPPRQASPPRRHASPPRGPRASSPPRGPRNNYPRGGPQSGPYPSAPRGPRRYSEYSHANSQHQMSSPIIPMAHMSDAAHDPAPPSPVQAKIDKSPSPPPKVVVPLPVIPKYQPQNPLRDVYSEIERLHTNRVTLTTEYVAIHKNTRRALHELDVSTIDLRTAETRRKVADAQMEKAKLGLLGMDAIDSDVTTVPSYTSWPT